MLVFKREQILRQANDPALTYVHILDFIEHDKVLYILRIGFSGGFDLKRIQRVIFVDQQVDFLLMTVS